MEVASKKAACTPVCYSSAPRSGPQDFRALLRSRLTGPAPADAMESFNTRACSTCHIGRRSARTLIICEIAARNGVRCRNLKMFAQEVLNIEAGKNCRIIYCSSCGRQLY